MRSTAAWVTRRPDGATIAVTFNSLPPDDNTFLNEAITTLGQAGDGVRAWPHGNLYLVEAASVSHTGAPHYLKR